MDPRILEAYERLVPIDQLAVDAVILSLRRKDQSNEALCRQVSEFLDRQQKEKEQVK